MAWSCNFTSENKKMSQLLLQLLSYLDFAVMQNIRWCTSCPVQTLLCFGFFLSSIFCFSFLLVLLLLRVASFASCHLGEQIFLRVALGGKVGVLVRG